MPDSAEASGRPQDRSSWGRFWADLAWSARVSTPTDLMAISVGLGGGIALLEGLSRRRGLGGLGVLGFLLALFLVGFPGVQRAWFLRALRGGSLGADEIWSMSWSFFGRFFRLELLLAIPFAALFIAVQAVTTGFRSSASTVSLRGVIPGVIVIGLIGDALLTFVVPELVFATNSVRVALRSGLRLLRDSWPASAPYVFTPGITLVALGQAFGGTRRTVVPAVVLGVAGAVFGLYFKGAITAFYLRARPEIREVALPRYRYGP